MFNARGLMSTVLVGTVLAFAAPAVASPTALNQAINHYWKNNSDRRIAKCIAWHESHFKAHAVSATNDHGIFQINKTTWYGTFRTLFDSGRIYTFDGNAEAAYRIYRAAISEYGWSGRWYPWSGARYCR